MYVIRRVWSVTPRDAREAATIVARIGALYHEAGQRSPVQVYFNGATLPGERGRVVMQWTQESIESPYAGGFEPLPGVPELSARLRSLADDTWIEFYELLTPDKAVAID